MTVLERAPITATDIARAIALVVLILVIAGIAAIVFGAPGSPLFDSNPYPQGSLFSL